MEIYSLAGIKIKTYKISLGPEWRKYQNLSGDSPIDILVKNEESAACKYRLEEYVLQGNYTKCYRYHCDIMFVDDGWQHMRILNVKDERSVSVFLLQIFYAQAVQRHMIQIHSSMIRYQNKGILFLGPSGIGKTTQAELWNQYRDALIINGDMNFVQETEEKFIGWGTPWHGSSPYCENTSVQICALVVLQQRKENSIRKLEGFEKVQKVSGNIIYPTWLENGMELCLETLDHLLKKLPVYELCCRPDEEAVQLVEERIFYSVEGEK